jgi:hypothetical protein
MTQGIEARVEAARRPRLGPRARLGAENWLWLGVGGRDGAAAAFLLHQLMAWPPHEDETLALFVGRDSLPGVVEHVTTRPRRRAAALPRRVGRRTPRVRARRPALRLSAAFALASLPLVALLGRRLGGPRVGLVATALVAPSWLFLFHGVYGRHVQPLPLLLARLHARLCCRRSSAAAGRWALWVAHGAARRSRPIPTGSCCSGGRRFVLVATRDRLREATLAGPPSSCWASRSGSPTSSSRTASTSGSGEAAEARRAGGDRALPVALRGRRERRLVAGDARRVLGAAAVVVAPPPRGAGLVLCLCRRHRGRVRARAARRLGGTRSPDI